MLARKAGYIHYEASRSVGHRTGADERKFARLLAQTISVLLLVCFFLLAYIALSAVKTNFSYALMQKKLHAQQLQRENEVLRVDMTVPVTVLYGQSHDKTGTGDSSR